MKKERVSNKIRERQRVNEKKRGRERGREGEGEKDIETQTERGRENKGSWRLKDRQFKINSDMEKRFLRNRKKL